MNGNDLNTQETKTETKMELARLVMLQLLSDGVITESECFKLRDKLIDELLLTVRATSTETSSRRLQSKKLIRLSVCPLPISKV